MRPKQVDGLAELLVRHLQDRNHSFGRDKRLDPVDVNSRRFAAGAVARVHRVLEHAETVLLQIPPKTRRAMALFFRFHRKIEKDIEPHDNIVVERSEFLGQQASSG